MIINLRNIPSGRSVIVQDVAMTESQNEGAGLQGTVSCRAEVDRIQFQIHLTVFYQCLVEQECSRCLTHNARRIKGRFRVLLQDREGARRCGSVDEESVDFFFSEEDTEIDIRQSLYDEIMTALPLMPLCSVDCRGIQNEELNANSERSENLDPRWEALKRLKEGRKE
ncbi:MAG: hypothetical protein GF344_20655 [Chitinivibrionales bacterium]|nr:hypothetical protein [Chitinivibrionales bacterium]MBD3359009.1 hypothetical protein [Chitinivibrionales bacterium]